MLKWLVCLASVGLAIGVSVNKCCPDNHTLFGTVCKPAVVEPWAPVIYNPMKRSFLQPGTFPEDWTFNVSFPKTCDVRALDFLSMDANPPFVIFVNGNLNAEGSVNPFIETDSYCIDSKGALICLEPDREDKIAVQKCCGHKGIYSEKKRSCQLSTVPETEFSHLRVLHKFPDCADRNSGYFIGGKINVSHFLQKDGSLKEKGGRILTKTQFCLEKIAENPDEPAHVFTCPPTVKHRHDDIRFTVYPMGLFLSVFFLAVTLIASCLLPSTYHVLHWRCQTNHVACLLVGDFLLAITQLSGEALRGPACFGTAIAMHFFFLAAFFWLNTMCFNIWWTFRTWSFVPWPMGPLHQSRDFFYYYERAVHTNEFGIFFRKDLRPASLDKSQEACRLRIYELYAWGGPLVIAGIAAFMDCLPEGSNPTFLRPRFGQNRCWFYGDAELLSYFFGPIGILLVFNLTLFAATARELTCGLWKTEVVKSNTERATLGRVCLKLVVVMGVTWVADVISWVVGGPDYVWFLTDVINTLQGVLIFIVVGCQPQVWAAVKRLWCLREQPGDNAHIRSSTSQAPPSLGDQSITKPVETLC